MSGSVIVGLVTLTPFIGLILLAGKMIEERVSVRVKSLGK